MKLLLHPTTQRSLNRFIESPAHAVLIVGPSGSGKGTVGAFVAASLLGVDDEKLAEYPYVKWLRDQEKGVSIESIRVAINFVQLKVPGTANFRRAVIVEQGETMSTEAQNAFLKLLEEPPADTLIIITVSRAEDVLPTIRSRAQAIQVLPPSLEQIKDYYGETYSDTEITKAFHISEGYVGLLQALLEGDTEHPLVTQIDTAKSLLSSNTFDRLAKVDELSKSKNVDLLLQAMERVCHSALTQSAKAGGPNTKRWVARLKAIVDSRQALSRKAQPKLLLTNLMLNL